MHLLFIPVVKNVCTQVGRVTIGYLHEVKTSQSGNGTSAAVNAPEEEPKPNAAEASKVAEIIIAVESNPVQSLQLSSKYRCAVS